MVIGYSFGDDHINEAIGKAADAGQLRIFIIDPEGIDVLNKQNPVLPFVSSSRSSTDCLQASSVLPDAL